VVRAENVFPGLVERARTRRPHAERKSHDLGPDHRHERRAGFRNGIDRAGSGALTGFALWLGFVAPTGLVNKVFPGHLKAWAIETGNHLVNFVAFGAIIGGWR
jgi:hypothetical protein